MLLTSPKTLLGRGAAQQMKLVKLNLSEVLQPFSKLKGPLTHITLQEDSTPYSVRAPRHVPFPLMQPLKEMLEKMEAMDIIVKTNGTYRLVRADSGRHQEDVRNTRMCGSLSLKPL